MSTGYRLNENAAGDRWLQANGGGFVAEFNRNTSPEEVEKIVRAVNSHADLVAACKAALEFWDQPPSGAGGNIGRKEWLDRVQGEIRAVLAKADGAA